LKIEEKSKREIDIDDLEEYATSVFRVEEPPCLLPASR
jgi:hypothetical protein